MRIPPSSFAILPVNRVQPNSPPKPEKALAQSEQKTTPPGLERVLARLQSLFEPTSRQTNATDLISRNIARYAQTQTISTAPVASTTQAPEASTSVDTTNSGIKASA